MLRRQRRSVTADVWTPCKGALTSREREDISQGHRQDISMCQIAHTLKRSPSTITRALN